MSLDLDEQYDKIYRYCYFRLHKQETAEDITQETFLRFLDNDSYRNTGQSLQYLYTIARNLCIDEYRKSLPDSLPENLFISDKADGILTGLSLKTALLELDQEDQELLLLRYVNEVPVSIICKMLGISRFAVYRKTKKALKQMETKLGKENFL